MSFGFTEILIIAFIVLLIFGGKRIPMLARSLGSSIGSFKKGLKDGQTAPDDTDSNLD